MAQTLAVHLLDPIPTATRNLAHMVLDQTTTVTTITRGARTITDGITKK